MDVKSFVKTCISVIIFVFLRHPVFFFFKNNILIDLQWSLKIRFVYLSFHTLLYFQHRVFLALDNVFSYYNKGTQRNQNKVINERNIIALRFIRSYVLQVNDII